MNIAPFVLVHNTTEVQKDGSAAQPCNIERALYVALCRPYHIVKQDRLKPSCGNIKCCHCHCQWSWKALANRMCTGPDNLAKRIHQPQPFRTFKITISREDMLQPTTTPIARRRAHRERVNMGKDKITSWDKTSQRVQSKSTIPPIEEIYTRTRQVTLRRICTESHRLIYPFLPQRSRPKHLLFQGV